MSDALVQEIINNTGLSPGTVMTASALGDVVTAFGQGRVSGAAVDYAQSIQGQQLPDPNSGGGGSGGGGSGGGGSGGGSDPSPSPDPDRSSLSVSLDGITRGDQDPVFSGGRQSALVSFTVTNQITSGDGARKTADVEITVDGSRVETVSVPTSPGESSSATVDIRGLTPGSRRVCVGLQ